MKKLQSIYLTSLPPLFSDLTNMVSELSPMLTIEEVDEKVQEFIASTDLKSVTDVSYHLEYEYEWSVFSIVYFRN